MTWLAPIALLLVAHDGAHVDDTEQPAQPEVQIAVEGSHRVVRSNGLPSHEHGAFPNRSNPNAIAPQQILVRMPAEPTANAEPTPLRFPNKFGIAVNGVLFDPMAAEWWQRNPRSGWTYEPLGTLGSGGRFLGLDESHAHVQPGGMYHYHGVPTGLVEQLRRKSGEPFVLVGWAADGFPIYAGTPDDGVRSQPLASSYRVREGTRASGPGGRFDGTFVEDYEYVAGSGDLDELNGRTAPTPEFPDGTYHYVLTDTFPFVPRLFRGTPDASFAAGPGGNRGGPPGRGMRGGRGFGPPSGGPPRGGRPPFGPPSRRPRPPQN